MVFGRRYRVTERIGTGGMADVYKAIDETLGRTVAVKVMHARFSDDPDFIQRFRHEAAAAANLSHPAIVNIYDYGVEGGTYYIVMEFVRGTDLKAIVRRQGALDPIKVAEYGAQACAALTVAHGYGIIHRDIKPQNIVLMPDGGIKVMDFGIARAVDSDSTQTGSVLGTAQYVSPEQAQGRKLGPESDLYSLGVVLYELATGRLPFEGDTPVSVALRHVNDIAPTPRSVNPAIPPALEAVILKAMQKDPAARYRSADEMREDLLRVVGGRSVSAPAGVGDTTVMPAVGRGGGAAASVERVDTGRGGVNPWVWVAVIVAAILVGLGAAAALGAFNGEPKVPATAGMTLEAAKQAIADAGLMVGDASTAPDPAVPAGQVISTDPASGTQVPRGQLVKIVVSSGPEMIAVPAVTGSGETTAVTALQAAGFAVDPIITREVNTEFANGLVFKTDPAAGTPAVKGSQVHIWVSLGPELVAVPTVVGKTQADATNALEDVGFKVKVTKRPDASAAVGSVVEQKPVGVTQAPKGSTVTIFVSTGPEQVSVPACIGLTQAEAVAKIQALGLVESVLMVDDTEPTHVGFVQDQEPAVGTKVNKGATVTIWVARLP